MSVFDIVLSVAASRHKLLEQILDKYMYVHESCFGNNNYSNHFLPPFPPPHTSTHTLHPPTPTHTTTPTGLRYLEAFFGLLIGVMCAMFGWMVRETISVYVAFRPLRSKGTHS